VTAPAERRRTALRAAALFAFALAVRALHFLAMRDSPLFGVQIGDAGQYDRWAQRIAAGDWLGSAVFYQTPLYPYLLGALYTGFGHEPWIVRAVQALFGATACVLLARTGARFFSERAGWIAGIVLALYAPAVFFDGILQKASLDLVLMSALLWLVAPTQDGVGRGRLFAAGAVLGAMTLNRENAAALVPVLVAWALWTGWPRGRTRAAAHAALVATGLGVVLVPVGLRNQYVGGVFLVTTSQMGSNFWIGNHRGADGGYTPMRAGRGDAAHERDDAREIAEDALKRPLDPGAVSRYWLARSWDDIRAAPAAWVHLLGWKWFLTWNRLELVDEEALPAHAHDSPVLAALARAIHFGVVLPIAVAGVWWTRRAWRRLWVLYAMAATFAASVTLFYVFARYRYPLVPIAVLFAGAGLDGLGEPLARRGRELAIGLALAGAAAIGANWPVPQRYDDDAITYYNAGTALLDEGRTRDAIALLERAQRADPGFPETYNNLGRAWLALGDVAAARTALERGVALAPDHAVLQLNLAAATLRGGDADRARAELARAIALDPLLAAAYEPLAELELRSGDAAGAIAHLQRAVELEPDSASAHADLGLVWLVTGHAREAADALHAALRLDPTLVPVRQRLAWIQATAADPALRDADAALATAAELCRGPGAEDPALLETLAAAHAATGAFDEAAAVAARAIERAQARSDAALGERLERERSEYRAGRALRLGFSVEPVR
jgi:tetratricopeptide (TPR) repeat protein